LKQLHAWYGDDVQFLDVIIRQAHPGEDRGRFENDEQKMAGARDYQQLEQIPWPVLVDDYAGTVHRTYSNEMADPTFLIDSDGTIVFYGMWTHAPTLNRAIQELLQRGGQGGPVAGGIDRAPHLLPALIGGYRGPRRGGRRGIFELDIGGFGAGSMSFIGDKLRPLLGDVALRAARPGEEPTSSSG
jgi:hypothetical protein